MTHQGSYRSSIVKFPGFSGPLTFQVMEWQFPWPYRNNNPFGTNVRNGTLYPMLYNNYETCHLWSNIKCS